MNGIRKFIAVLLASATAACSPASFNFTVSRSGYSIQHDITYGFGPRANLDLYIPEGLTAPASVILFFYGGNWENGSKDYYLALGEALASKGFIVAVADYRLYPAVKFPEILEDGAKAFKYIHDNAARFGGDPQRIFLAGHSAGAYNAIMLVSDPRYLKASGADISWVRGAIGIAGPYDFLPLEDPMLVDLFGGANRAETQPIHFIDGKRPPMFLATGSDDTTVLPRNTVNMAARLRGVGSNVEEKIYPGIGHLGILLSLTRFFRFRAPLREDITDFINAHYPAGPVWRPAFVRLRAQKEFFRSAGLKSANRENS